MKLPADIEKLLPLGYLYLVVLGILKESFHYYQLGINILNYSSIMDILISPIAYITSSPIILITIIAMFVFHYYLPGILLKHKMNKFLQKMLELKSTDGFTIEQAQTYYNEVAVKTLAMTLLSFFIGTGIAGGYFTREKIEANTLKYEHTLVFNDEKSKKVNILGTNSMYYFYISKGQKNIEIAPIGSIKNLEVACKLKYFTK
ncbi:hypothetical protein [Flavobacterium hungaricum]|uniref:RDD family protein n=1 Tax=Flavobacterium hungaricum TaxID=2082725 RepID=A0ABR9THI3_9FLAO|nr:hypothetical protein [Flavobacterium hungaricum]MBE8724800.1 hypothetical protein [Flavobacterium hungaricum]